VGCTPSSKAAQLPWSCGCAEAACDPERPIAKKKELLFSDDFEREELGKAWTIVVPTFSIEKGALKWTQMRFDAPAADGKPAVKGHRAMIGSEVRTKNSVIEFRFRLGGAQSVTAEFDDREFTGSHYGHICMARIGAKGDHPHGPKGGRREE
jgi:hypothetical protein